MSAAVRPLAARQGQPTVRLVANDRPLMFSPALAEKVGLEGAVFLQQLHYWTSQPGAHERDGHRWVYNTIDQWLEQFPFWSRSALHRVISGLEAKGVIVATAGYNAKGSDRTKWYRINYEHADIATSISEHDAAPAGQKPSNGAISRIRDMDIANPENGICISRNRDLLRGKQETTTETTTENDTPLPPKGVRADSKTDPRFAEFYAVWPKKVARVDAEKAWIKLKPDDALFAAIMDRARLFRDVTPRDRLRFVPNPATFLNGRRWEDDPPEPESNPMEVGYRPAPKEAPDQIRKRISILEQDIARLERTGAPDWMIRNVRREIESARSAIGATG